ncbi:MAG: dihydrolipoyl dehydrogenase [Candidatus Heimdallarchaeota archaeon]
MVQEEDVLVIGAGPGGYPAAIRAAQLGKKVLLVEKGTIGGECLNWGCIPSKALISAADLFYKAKNAPFFQHNDNLTVNVKQLQAWKESVQNRLIKGIKQLLKGNEVRIENGAARFVGPNQVEIITQDGKSEFVNFASAIIATGGRQIPSSLAQIDDKNVLGPKGALELESIPVELVCVGSGSSSLEIATLYAKLGSKVTIIESSKNLAPDLDPELTRLVRSSMKKMGIEIFTEIELKRINTDKKGTFELFGYDKKKNSIKFRADKIFLEGEKHAATQGLGLEQVGIVTHQDGFIPVNAKQQSNIPHIFAVGDVTGKPFLAHRATKQGIIAAEVIAGKLSEADFRAIPNVIFTDPEIAFVGLTERETQKADYKVVTGRVSFGISGRAMTQLSEAGYIKVVAEEETGTLLGVQIVGPNASDLISEVALALEMGAALEDLGFTMHPHPTLSEMIMEVADVPLGKAIHVMNRLAKKKTR